MIKFLVLALFSFSAHASLQWKSVYISGDHTIANFDNGRKTLASLLAPLGAHTENSIHMTSEAKELSNRVYPATQANIAKAFQSLRVNPKTDGCLVFMTSHGSKNAGLFLSRSGILTPSKLGQMLQTSCGDAPTVVLISACFSGQFLVPEMAGKNRIILTAARNDRPSFGCSADTTYTYWDECLIDHIPSSRTWSELSVSVKACINEKEKRLGFDPSHPQAFFGEAVKNLPILNR